MRSRITFFDEDNVILREDNLQEDSVNPLRGLDYIYMHLSTCQIPPGLVQIGIIMDRGDGETLCDPRSTRSGMESSPLPTKASEVSIIAPEKPPTPISQGSSPDEPKHIGNTSIRLLPNNELV